MVLVDSSPVLFIIFIILTLPFFFLISLGKDLSILSSEESSWFFFLIFSTALGDLYCPYLFPL